MGHIHADLMAAYAEDAKETDKPWERWQYLDSTGKWNDFTDDEDHPGWFTDLNYRRKPKTISINGIEVPEPVREPLPLLTHYFTPDLHNESYFYYRHIWNNDQSDKAWLERGVIRLTAEAATQHTKALLSFTERKQ